MSLDGFAYLPPVIIDEDFLWHRDRITEAINKTALIPPQALALIVQEDKIYGIGRLSRGRSISSFQRLITIDSIELVETPLSLSELLARMPHHTKHHAGRVLRDGGKLPPATWRDIETVLINNHPEFAAYIRIAHLSLDQPSWIRNTESNTHNIMEHERDALALVLRITGFGSSLLNRWCASPQPGPFLSGLDHIVLTEDQLLGNDMTVFGDWIYRETKGVMARFSNTNGEQLTVINVNRTKLETTLGADLIYYNTEYNAFTIVQYKRMRPEKRDGSYGTATYYPNTDRNLKKQIRQMAILEKIPPGKEASRSDYRIGDSFCYIKVCKPTYDLSAAKLSTGMYIDIELWDLMEKEYSSDRKPFVVKFGSKIRYLTNTNFASMVSDGWIGSRNLSSRLIGTYIETALSEDRSVTLALSQ